MKFNFGYASHPEDVEVIEINSIEDFVKLQDNSDEVCRIRNRRGCECRPVSDGLLIDFQNKTITVVDYDL